jgi:nitronate monooxygenase
MLSIPFEKHFYTCALISFQTSTRIASALKPRFRPTNIFTSEVDMATMLREWFPRATSPFICNAPMFGFANSELAASVTKAGGFGIWKTLLKVDKITDTFYLGFIGGGLDFTATSTQISKLRSELSTCRKLLDIPPEEVLPIGVGFLMFQPENFLQGIIPVLQEHRPAAVWLFAAKDGERYAQYIPTLRAEGKSWGLKIFVQLGSVTAAKEALEDGADILVVQGTDAGGHQFALGAGLMALLPEVVDMVNASFPESKVAIIAAGGIMDGRGIAAAQALGSYIPASLSLGLTAKV